MEGNNHRNNVIREYDTAQIEAPDKGKPAAHPFFNAYLIPDGHFAEFRAKDKHALLAHGINFEGEVAYSTVGRDNCLTGEVGKVATRPLPPRGSPPL